MPEQRCYLSPCGKTTADTVLCAEVCWSYVGLSAEQGHYLWCIRWQLAWRMLIEDWGAPQNRHLKHSLHMYTYIWFFFFPHSITLCQKLELVLCWSCCLILSFEALAGSAPDLTSQCSASLPAMVLNFSRTWRAFYTLRWSHGSSPTMPAPAPAPALYILVFWDRFSLW